MKKYTRSRKVRKSVSAEAIIVGLVVTAVIVGLLAIGYYNTQSYSHQACQNIGLDQNCNPR